MNAPTPPAADNAGDWMFTGDNKAAIVGCCICLALLAYWFYVQITTPLEEDDA